jgi:hypothetical protein
VAYVQVAIGLGGKPRTHAPAKATNSVVFVDDRVNEIGRAWFIAHRATPWTGK